MLGNGLQGTLLGVRGQIEGMDTITMGYIMSAYYIGYLGGSKITPILLQSVGHVRVFGALGSLLSGAFILYAEFVNPYIWFALRLLTGFVMAGLYVVAESWLNDISTNKNRGQTLSLYMITMMTGMVLSQTLLNVGDPGGYSLFVMLSVLVSLSFMPILLSVSPAPAFEGSKPMTIKGLYKASPLGFVGSFMLGATFSATFGMASVYGTSKGMSLSQISFFVMSIFLGNLVIQYPIGWLSDRIDRRVLVILLSACSVIAAASVFILPDNFYILCAITFIAGGIGNPLYSLLIAYTNDYLEHSQMAAASGSLIFVNGLGAMGGPIVVGWMMSSIGPKGFYLFIALTTLVIFLFGLYRMTVRQTTNDDHVPYMQMEAVTTTSLGASMAAEVAIEEMEDNQAEKSEDKPKD